MYCLCTKTNTQEKFLNNIWWLHVPVILVQIKYKTVVHIVPVMTSGLAISVTFPSSVDRTSLSSVTPCELEPTEQIKEKLQHSPLQQLFYFFHEKMAELFSPHSSQERMSRQRHIDML